MSFAQVSVFIGRLLRKAGVGVFKTATSSAEHIAKRSDMRDLAALSQMCRGVEKRSVFGS